MSYIGKQRTTVKKEKLFGGDTTVKLNGVLVSASCIRAGRFAAQHTGVAAQGGGDCVGDQFDAGGAAEIFVMD